VLADTNNLGIKELVAVGESDFSGSPRNRRVNIGVGASRFQGLILKPGEEFSFNKFLGDVDGEHGFLPELVIKRSGLVPEFGGGLCQVSSTAFRAAMNAGVDITERRNHSFAVRYYAPQGTDATIYPGVTDFKFTNDLPSHLLIRTKIDGDKLYFEFYGTKDDRKITFDGPYQYDKKLDGSMKAVWTRWVEKNGQKTEEVFRSTYQPPALFQQTTQASTPNPDANQNSGQPGTENPDQNPDQEPDEETAEDEDTEDEAEQTA
jgi:vancomycin resistance protein YoaR